MGGGITYLQQISITIIYAFSAEVDHFRKEKLIHVTLLLWADAKKVGLRRLFRLNNVTGSFNPYGFQDDKVKTGFWMTSMEVPAYFDSAQHRLWPE
jgi:hypothetical protein